MLGSLLGGIVYLHQPLDVPMRIRQGRTDCVNAEEPIATPIIIVKIVIFFITLLFVFLNLLICEHRKEKIPDVRFGKLISFSINND
mgnify:CR=1 FL=1